MIWGMIRGPRSLLARILLWHGVAMALTASAVSAGVYLFLDLTADQFERQTLRAHVEDIRATIANSSGPVSHGKPQTRSTGPLLAAGMSAIIIDGEGRRSIFAGTPPTLSNARIPRTVTENYFTRRSRRAFYAGLSVPVALPQGRSWIVAFQNLDHPANVMDDIAGQFLRHGLFVIAPLLALLLGIDAYIIRRALKPVRRASALVKTIDPARSNIRVFDPAIPSEVQPLADAINMALTRLTDSLRMQREFTADAAHELRTPITIARVRAAEIADADLRAALIADLDILSGVVGHLLDMAELDSLDQVAMEAVDLAALARQAVATVAPLVFRSGRSIELLGAEREARIIGAPHFLNRALGALLENAVKHTSPGTAIQVRVGSDMISVADDGPGIASGDQGLIFQRFWRRNRSTVANAGLGLAIVQRVVEVHGGSVALCSEPGRAEFILKFAGHPNLKPPFSIRSNKCDDEIPR